MAIHDGRGTNRRHGHNYIGPQADARLQEIIRPAQQRGLNALDVDSFPILYFRRANSSVACTCQKAQALASDGISMDLHPDLPDHIKPDIVIDDNEDIVIDHNAPLFGTRNTNGYYDEDSTGPGMAGGVIDDEEIVEDDIDARSEERLFAMSTDCGICYRNGMVPGYELYGHDRKVLTTAVVENTYGYTIDQVAAPNRFCMVDPEEGFVDFSFYVPKYFEHMRFSVRDNGNHLPDESLYLPTAVPQVLTAAAVRAAAGTQLTVRVRTPFFTHVVVDFDLGVEPVVAALAQDTKATDWTLFDTMGTLTIVLPMTIGSVETSDVIYVPGRKRTLKISDVTYLRTARNKNLDWQVQARVLQPQEALKRIWQANKLV